MLTFDLAEETEALHGEQGWRDSGHSAKTLAKHQEMAIVLIAMKRGTHMKEHRTDGGISVHVLRGCIQVHLGRRRVKVPAGSLFALERSLDHEVEALEDSAFVLSVRTGSSDRG